MTINKISSFFVSRPLQETAKSVPSERSQLVDHVNSTHSENGVGISLRSDLLKSEDEYRSKVERLKDQVKSGTYSLPSSEKIAASFLIGIN